MKVIAGVVVWLVMVAGADETATTPLIDFEIQDQFRQEHCDEDWLGNVLLLIGSDRKGSQFDSVWEKAITDSLAGQPDAESLLVVHVADVRGVPFFLKGMVRGKFPQDAESPVILDWKGRFASSYGFAADKANLLVFDRAGRLQQQVAVTDLDSPTLNELVESLIMALQASEPEA